jgi:hypothetical protein
MVKTALSPFKALAGLVGANPESLEKLPFTFAQDSLDSKLRADLTKLAGIMKKKPDLIVTITQTTDQEEEKKQIAVQLTKNDFLSAPAANPNTPRPKANELKDDDPNLLAFIRKTVSSVDSIGIQKASLKRVDAGRIEARFQAIMAIRNKLINEFLIVNQGIPAASVIVSSADLRNLPQELKVPQFKVEVSIK